MYDMTMKLKDQMKEKSSTDLYDMRMKHLRAMSNSRLPKDFMAEFTGNHFLHDGYDHDEVNFQIFHRTAGELLAEAKPNYSERRLATQAHPYTIFLLWEIDVEKKNDDIIWNLFVEAFGDKSRFFNVCLTEIERTEMLILDLRSKI